jgi:hypothetical protein
MYDMGAEFGNTTTTSGHYRGIELRFIISSGRGNARALRMLKSLEKIPENDECPGSSFVRKVRSIRRRTRLGCPRILRHDNVISVSTAIAPHPPLTEESHRLRVRGPVVVGPLDLSMQR